MRRGVAENKTAQYRIDGAAQSAQVLYAVIAAFQMLWRDEVDKHIFHRDHYDFAQGEYRHGKDPEPERLPGQPKTDQPENEK
ncbi:hypothetical protein D3C85_1721320 [compost metagenome]